VPVSDLDDSPVSEPAHQLEIRALKLNAQVNPSIQFGIPEAPSIVDTDKASGSVNLPVDTAGILAVIGHIL
jgi:hypothetical protein